MTYIALMCVLCDSKADWPSEYFISIQCEKITSITIPAHVNRVGQLMCKNCPNLTEIKSDSWLVEFMAMCCNNLRTISGRIETVNIVCCNAVIDLPQSVEKLTILGEPQFMKDLDAGTYTLPSTIKSMRIDWYWIKFSIPRIESLEYLAVHDCMFLSAVANQPKLDALLIRECPFVYISKTLIEQTYEHPQRYKCGSNLRDAAQRARETVRRRAEVARVLDGVLLSPLIRIILTKITIAHTLI